MKPALLTCLAACVLSCAPLLAAEPAMPPGAVATVNGKPVPRALLDELAKARGGGEAAGPEERRRMLDDLVLTELLSQRAHTTGLATRPQTRAELELAQKTLLSQRLQQQMAAEMQIDDTELQARYRALPPDAQIDSSHILLKDEALAREIITKLQRGASFAALARQHSTDTESRSRGGALGAMLASELTPPYAAAARALKPGQTSSEPVRTEFGWHVIRLVSQRNLDKPPFEALKAGLRAQVVRERMLAQLAQWRKEAKLTVLQAP